VIDHISVAVSDLQRSIEFYDAALVPLGITRLWTVARAAGYGHGGADEFFAIRQTDGSRAVGIDPNVHTAFSAATREAAAAFHARALERGGTDDGPPGLQDEYGPGYYAAFVLDPDGNRLEAVLHEPVP
jgi:catechol 2,3-dioxygenase-like lactoylglutathione lyase family enzyme